MREEKVWFKNSKGQELCGLINIPNIKGPFPVVIICHGFKGNKNSPLYSFLAREFAKAGFLAFRFDFHGHGESEGHFEDITISQEVKDLKSAINFISSYALADKKIGLTGHSLGGFVILRYVAKFNKIGALIPMSPISDFVDFQNDLRKQSSDYDLWKKRGKIHLYYPRIDRWYRLKYSFYLDGMEEPTLYSEVKKITCPVLIFHGKHDSAIPLHQTHELIKHLKCKYKLVLLDEPHVYRKLSTFKLVAEQSISWFKKYLK